MRTGSSLLSYRSFFFFFSFNRDARTPPTRHCRRRWRISADEPTPGTSFPSSSRIYSSCIFPVRDIIALIHFHCVLARKHKSSRPRKSYGTMLTGMSLSPWSVQSAPPLSECGPSSSDGHAESPESKDPCRNIIARDIAASPFSFLRRTRRPGETAVRVIDATRVHADLCVSLRCAERNSARKENRTRIPRYLTGTAHGSRRRGREEG